MTKSDDLRRSFAEPGCQCPSLRERMVAELEQVEVPLCRVHQKAEIEERERAKVRQSLDDAHAVLRGLRLEHEREAESAPPEPVVDPLEGALISKLNPAPSEIAARLGIPISEQDDDGDLPPAA